ncbi:hypothetical protein [Amycolatopsis sp. GM8]|uniref:hypothetical protein n=1 Tax=Amycolatopsis sp. GM8 TaxID=2896530 RepID=UPI001F323246|nr:hypothetical protein [Amycolatopsis sp. GM8]
MSAAVRRDVLVSLGELYADLRAWVAERRVGIHERRAGHFLASLTLAATITTSDPVVFFEIPKREESIDRGGINPYLYNFDGQFEAVIGNETANSTPVHAPFEAERKCAESEHDPTSQG